MIERQLRILNKATSTAGADEWLPSPEAVPAMPYRGLQWSLLHCHYTLEPQVQCTNLEEINQIHKTTFLA